MRRSALLASSGSSAIVQSPSLPALQPPASPVGVAGTSSDAPGGHAAANQASTALMTLQPGGPSLPCGRNLAAPPITRPVPLQRTPRWRR